LSDCRPYINRSFASVTPRVETLSFIDNSKKRQPRPGSAPTSSISAQTGWKPILHYLT
jgi:hypothetical protein